MRVAEIIRQVLDVIDQAEAQQAEQPVEDMGYTEKDIKRFRQIAGLTTDKQYTTEPNEQYMDVAAVTVDAGADQWQGTKHPADIRGEHPSLYPGTVHGAK
jgi:2-hydroxychromene-2-carboxylate isomerase